MNSDETAEQIDVAAAPSGDGCADCESAQPQGWWFHLRRCAGCGHVGCCDSSPNQHARAHADDTGHRVVRSFEPGETWFYDFAEDVTYASGPELAPPLAHPADQPAPGPRGRVPGNWRSLLNR
ncbi:UBP-type zinc finger domain-containing protein [Kineococcus sp. SYSU DK006]|uniref:UBP-type zinc finger domain-containing protein n=1 Tax=Kineococcus sp. SYSU DK006 TaxID=3383127 RepID=UPI003D7D13EE